MTDSDKAKAAALVAGWFWQPVEGHSYRYKFATKTLTRYYECVPVAADSLRLILEYLRDEDPGETIDLLGKKVDLGPGWTVKDVWYQTAANDQWEGTKSDKVRIYQTLLLPSEDGKDGDGPYTVEDGCQYKVTHKFYWSVAELPTLPTSSSGVQYTMQGVTRDSETGLFSCVIEMRERVQQDVDKYTNAIDIYEKKEIEQHLGVKKDNVDSTGQAASVGGGVLVTRRLEKNADCTTNVENVTTTEEGVTDSTVEKRKTLRGTVETKIDRNQTTAVTASTEAMVVGETRRSEKTPGGLYNNTVAKVTTEGAGEIARDCTQTIFEHTHAETENQLTAPTGDAPAASGGVVTRITGRETEEGTWDVTTQTTTENGVTDSTKEYRKTLRGTVETTVDRNQTTAVTASTEAMVVGETRRSEKTPGGLYNNTVAKVTTEGAGEIARDCTQTIFEHTHAETENQLTAPTGDAPAASGGVVTRITGRETEEGTWDVTTQTTTETGVADSTVEKRKTLRGTVETKIDRNQTTAVTASTEAMVVGETRRSEKTPGGLYNNTVAKVTTEGAGEIARDCTQTIFEHTHAETENQLTAPTGDAPAASGGVVTSITGRETEEGTWDVTTQTTTENGVTSATKEYRKTLRGTVETTVDRNQAAALQSSGMVVGETRRSEKTPGGLYNNTTAKVTADGAGKIATDCTKTIFEHQHVETNNQKEAPTSDEASAAANGVIERKTARETEEGTWDVTTTTTTEQEADDSVKEYRKTLYGTVKTTVDRNQAAALTDTGMVVGETRRSEKTPGGLYNNTTVEAPTDGAGKISQSCENTELVHTDATVTNQADEPEDYERTVEVNKVKMLRGQQQENGTWNVTEQTTEYKEGDKEESWSDENYTYTLRVYRNQEEPILPAAPVGDEAYPENVSCSFHENEHGSFDGQYLTRVRVSGGEGDTLAYHIGPVDISTYIYYMKGGKFCRRKFTGKVERFYGKLNVVQRKVMGQYVGDTKIGESCEMAGWRSQVNPTAKTFAMGVKYTDITPGDEEVVTSGSVSGGAS